MSFFPFLLTQPIFRVVCHFFLVLCKFCIPLVISTESLVRSSFLQYTIGRKVSTSVVKLMSSYWISVKRLTLYPMRGYLLSLTSMELEVKCTGGLNVFCQIVHRMFQLTESLLHQCRRGLWGSRRLCFGSCVISFVYK